MPSAGAVHITAIVPNTSNPKYRNKKQLLNICSLDYPRSTKVILRMLAVLLNIAIKKASVIDLECVP